MRSRSWERGVPPPAKTRTQPVSSSGARDSRTGCLRQPIHWRPRAERSPTGLASFLMGLIGRAALLALEGWDDRVVEAVAGGVDGELERVQGVAAVAVAGGFGDVRFQGGFLIGGAV